MPRYTVAAFFSAASNYAYRLIFVLLCLPQLFDWVGDSTNQHGDTRKAASILLALIYFLLWCLVRGDKIWRNDFAVRVFGLRWSGWNSLA